MNENFKMYMQLQRERIDSALQVLLRPDHKRMNGLFDAMNYSLLAGGKRVRPILLLTALDDLGVASIDYLQIACAIECVHTYSLIHDDLPCMDNDDYRRGKLTCHKKFTPGIATLAGDGLLTVAFELIATSTGLSAEVKLELINILAKAAGPNGMVGGQYIDICAVNGHAAIDELQYMDLQKTGRLLRAPLVMAGVIANASKIQMQVLSEYGNAVGLLFQIVDDILDEQSTFEEMGKQQGQDQKMGKSTYATILGREEAYQRAIKETHRAQQILLSTGWESGMLKEFSNYLLTRIQ